MSSSAAEAHASCQESTEDEKADLLTERVESKIFDTLSKIKAGLTQIKVCRSCVELVPFYVPASGSLNVLSSAKGDVLHAFG